jgi:hypothetical protein
METASTPATAGPPVWVVGREAVLTVGEAEGDPHFLFSGVSGVRLLPEGGLVVGDRGSGTIRLYHADGSFRTQMGGLGQGPGEFASLRTVLVAAPDTLVAYDSEAYRVTRFLTSGELLGTVPIQATGGFPEVYLGQIPSGDHVIAWIKQIPRDRTAVTTDTMEVERFGPDGRLVASVLTAQGMRRRGSPIAFSPHFLAARIQDTLFVVDGFSGTITVWSVTGEPARRIQVPAQPEAQANAHRLLEQRLLSLSDTFSLRLFRQSSDVDSIPTLSDMLTDEDGRLWVKHYAPATDSHLVGRDRSGGTWFVLDAAGTVIAVVTMPNGVRLMDARGDRVAGLSRDSLGVERAVVYEMHRDLPAP